MNIRKIVKLINYIEINFVFINDLINIKIILYYYFSDQLENVVDQAHKSDNISHKWPKWDDELKTPVETHYWRPSLHKMINYSTWRCISLAEEGGLVISSLVFLHEEQKKQIDHGSKSRRKKLHCPYKIQIFLCKGSTKSIIWKPLNKITAKF